MFYFYEDENNLVRPRRSLLFVHPLTYFKCRASVRKCLKLKEKKDEQKKITMESIKKETAYSLTYMEAIDINSEFERQERIEKSFLWDPNIEQPNFFEKEYYEEAGLLDQLKKEA